MAITGCRHAGFITSAFTLFMLRVTIRRRLSKSTFVGVGAGVVTTLFAGSFCELVFTT
jgi:hypothetical protein